MLHSQFDNGRGGGGLMLMCICVPTIKKVNFRTERYYNAHIALPLIIELPAGDILDDIKR